MKVNEFEKRVREVEKIRIVVRANESTPVQDYPYSKAADENWTVTDLLNKRIYPCLGDYSVEAVKSDGSKPHGGTKLKTLRESYK